MSAPTIGVIVLMVLYAVFALGIGQYASKQMLPGRAQYFVAGGTLQPVVSFFTYMATFASAFAFAGLPAIMYLWGIDWVWYEAVPVLLFFSVITTVIGLRIYKVGKMHNFITNSDLVALRIDSNEPVRILLGFIMTVFPSIFYVGIQLVAMSAILSGLTGGEMPYTVVLFFFAGIMAIYIVLGGMRSVAYTDTFQGITMFLLIAAGIIIVWTQFGGIQPLYSAATASERAWIFDRHVEIQYFYSAIVVGGIAWSGLIPHLWVRFYAANSVRSVVAAGFGSGIGGAVNYFILPTILGAALVALYPETPALEVSEQLVAILFADWFGPVLAAVFMFGVVAAGKSTADSVLLNLSSVISVDILEKTFKVKWPERTLDITARLVCLIVLAIAVVAAFAPELPIVRIAISLIWSSFTVIAMPVFIMLFWRRANKYGVLAGLATGFIAIILTQYVIFPEWPHNPWGLWEGAIPAYLGIVVTIVVSLLTPATPKKILDHFYGTGE